MTLTSFIWATAFLMFLKIVITAGLFTFMGNRFKLIANLLGVAAILGLGWLFKFLGFSGTKICESNALPESVATFGVTFDVQGCVNHYTYFTNLGGLTETTFGVNPFIAAVLGYCLIELARRIMLPFVCHAYRTISEFLRRRV